MIALVLSLALQATPVVAPTDASDIIVVANRKLSSVAVTMVFTDDNKLRSCKIKGRTGDPDIDAFWCGAAHACADAGAHSKADLTTCITARREEFIAAYAAKRAAGQAGTGVGSIGKAR